MECHCPQLYKILEGGDIQEAILDVVVAWPGLPALHYIDVTIHSAFASSLRKATTCPGVAAAGGEKGKFNRYGREVLPISMETLGRVGDASLQSVDFLKSRAAVWGKLSALQHWRRALEHAGLWELADAAILSCPAAF